MKVFTTDAEYLQSAIDSVARLTYEKAVDVMQGGNIAKLQADALQSLSLVALHYGLSNTTVNFYFQIVDEENRRSDWEGEYYDN